MSFICPRIYGRGETQQLSPSGAILVPLELYRSETNHVTFRLIGDSEQRIFVSCPLTDRDWAVCATHVVQTVIHGASPAVLNALASAEVVAVIRLVQQMERTGCPVHREKPVAAKNDIDDAIISRITPEFISQLIASAG